MGLAVTVLLHFAGQYLFATPLACVLTFVLTDVVLVIALPLLFARARLDPLRRMRVALSLALPGMLLDIFSVTFVADFFPNIPAAAHACLLWAYSLVPLPGAVSLADETTAAFGTPTGGRASVAAGITASVRWCQTGYAAGCCAGSL